MTTENKNINDTAIDESEETSTNKVEPKRKKKTYVATLQYGIAALSLVSFMTTSEGLQAISNDPLTPYLISFGIQVLVLIVGNQFVKIMKSISKLSLKRRLRRFIAVTVIASYISAVCFSSFFSYVFLANGAYRTVKETDYNIDIDNFLNEEISNLEAINNAAGKVLLAQVQSYVPQFKDILSDLDKIASTQLGDIKNSITLYEKDKIDEKVIFTADSVIANNENDLNSLETFEANIRQYVNQYENYYKQYKADYDALMNLEDNTADFISLAEKRIESIASTITTIEGAKMNMNSIRPPTNYGIKTTNSIRNIDSYFLDLISSYKKLKEAYEAIKSNVDIDNAQTDLSDIYKTIYSTVNIDGAEKGEKIDKDVEEAINSLKGFIEAYITSNDINKNADGQIDEIALQNLSSCITYLGEFQKYIKLSTNINSFKEDALNQVYVIDYETTTEGDSENSKTTVPAATSVTESVTQPVSETETSSQNEIVTEAETTKPMINVNKVNTEEWNYIRRQDLGEFIKLVKSLPNIEMLTALSPSDETENYIDFLKDNKKYKTEILKDAYELNRQELEKISNIEQAWNFFFSDFKYMAIYCMSIALFLDLSSLFVGIFVYFVSKDKGRKDLNNTNVENRE